MFWDFLKLLELFKDTLFEIMCHFPNKKGVVSEFWIRHIIFFFKFPHRAERVFCMRMWYIILTLKQKQKKNIINVIIAHNIHSFNLSGDRQSRFTQSRINSVHIGLVILTVLVFILYENQGLLDLSLVNFIKSVVIIEVIGNHLLKQLFQHKSWYTSFYSFWIS